MELTKQYLKRDGTCSKINRQSLGPPTMGWLGPSSRTWYLYKTEAHRHTSWWMSSGAEIGVHTSTAEKPRTSQNPNKDREVSTWWHQREQASANTWSPPPALRPGREHLSVVFRCPVLVVCDHGSRRSTHQASDIKANTKISHYGASLGAFFMNAFVICHFAFLFDTIYPILHRPAVCTLKVH